MERLIVAGFGGQGVLSLGQMIAYASMYENKNVNIIKYSEIDKSMKIKTLLGFRRTVPKCVAAQQTVR